MTRFPFMPAASRKIEPHERGGVGDDCHIRAGIVWNFETAFDDAHRPGTMRQHRQNRVLVHPVRTRNTDHDLDLHRVDRQTYGVCDAEPVVPERVAQGAHGRLRVIRSADIGAHADLEHHAPQVHFRLSYALSSDRSRCARGWAALYTARRRWVSTEV